MNKLLVIVAGAMIALCYGNAAWAQAAPAPEYGYSADEIAENQGVVAYWYAWGFSYAYGHFPASFAELKEHGLPLRGFFSPHTETEIDFDDESLDFNGDMTYALINNSPQIRIQTTNGIVALPGTLTRTDDCGETFCCDIGITKNECWKVCDDNHAACAILQWMMWKSFETHQCRYGYRPVDEAAWMASGFSPIEADWRTRYPFMTIKLYYGKCELKKARVTCCAPCPTCEPCAVAKPCGQCEKPEPNCKSKCNTCLDTTQVHPASENCNKCKSKQDVRCGKCQSCISEVNRNTGCRNCASVSQSQYSTFTETPTSPQSCTCDAWVPAYGSQLISSLNIEILASEGTQGSMKLLLLDPQHRQMALINLPGPIEGDYTYTHYFDNPVTAKELFSAALINDGSDPATLTEFRATGLGDAGYSYVYVDHTCTGAVVGPGGCATMTIE